MANEGQFIFGGESLEQFVSAIKDFKDEIKKLCEVFEERFITGCQNCMKDAQSQAILNRALLIPKTLLAIIEPTTCVEQILLDIKHNSNTAE